MSARPRAAWLRREIRRHDRLYYEQARPEISDAEYDALLHALGIPLVGAHVARVLAARFRSLDRLASADAGEIGAIRGIGPTIAGSVAKFFAESANREVCRRLVAAGVRTTERAAPHGTTPRAVR